MGKRMWVWFMMLFLVSGLVLATSCTKTAVVQPDPAIAEREAEMAALKAEEAAAQEAEMARKKQLEAERLQQQKLERERLAREKAAAMERAKAAARSQFQDEDILFDFDSAALGAEAEAVLKRKAEWLRSNSGVSAIIEGHCDDRGTNEYNLALGDRRAESARSYLIDLGIRGSRLTAISYGEERPVSMEKSESGWAKNRRAHCVID